VADPGAYPFTSFNFEVEITLAGEAKALYEGAFSECDGLEMTQEVKTIREGGNNGVQVRLAGPSAYGQLTLKRGMTSSRDAWRWFERVQREPGLRATAEIVLLAADGETEEAHWVLQRCLPTKLKAPPLNAKDGTVAIEELGLVYESLTLRPEGGGA
jgi:phage tail-like protein